MAIFVLVHGSFQASWCWREVAPRLEARGHRVMTFDLPGHGTDPTPPERVSFQNYVDSIQRVVGGLDERPILVEHSMGTPIAAVAEAERIPSQRSCSWPAFCRETGRRCSRR
jgi:pimeloyl-ACP methyl ester carboxylesterase